MKKGMNFAILSIGIGIIVALIYTTGVNKIYTALTGANPFYIALAISVSAFILGTKLLRWTYLFQYINKKDSISIYLFGTGINLIAPIGTGDLSRAFIAKKKFKISLRKTISATIIERIVDTTFLMVMTLFLFFIVVQERESIYFLAIPVGLLISAYVLVFSRNFIYRISYIFEKMFEKEEGFFNHITNKISLSLQALKNAIDEYTVKKSILVLTILLTAVSWSIEALSIYILLLAFGETVFFPYLIGVVAASWIVGAFSFIPGGIGAKEGSFAFFLGFLEVSLDIATTVGLMARIINILICSGGFFISSLRLSVKLADITGDEIDSEDGSN